MREEGRSKHIKDKNGKGIEKRGRTINSCKEDSAD
jgi:hypothetical protein